ncbi:epsin-2-like isoform X2 [Watersipora subatra]|uniref:epsin-2-like isoform X2 n=1 Tax=Watersipora subatra TaxID=2589382 RepID=UPI00355ADD8D
MPVMRSVKNMVKNYTDAEVKVRKATSNDPWGPSSTLMSEIADLTYNVVAFTEIMAMIWKRLSDHGKNWRHVYKSLTLLEYIMKTGSEKVAQQCKENIFAIQTLSDFQHMEDNKDLGANVREKAKVLIALLKDDERLKNERAKALKTKERFTENFGIGSDSTSRQLGRPKHRPTLLTSDTPTPSSLANPDLEQARPHSAGEEELQLQLALAMSKEEAENDAKKKTNDDLKLQMALEESQKDALPPEAPKAEHLLDFAGAGRLAAPPSTSDPWNPSAQAPINVTTTDPWSPQPASTAAVESNASPFSPVIGSSSDPWAPTNVPSAPASNNPWDAPAAQPAVNNDPWGAGPPVSQATSPWQANGGSATKPATVDDDFDALGMRTTVMAETSASNGGSLFDMQEVQGSLPPLPHGQTSLTASKRPEDFLDTQAKPLVNIDNLVVKHSTPGTVNPFAMTNHGTGSVPINSNPFHAQQPPRPSLNQMSATTNMGGFNNGQQPLVNPMMPMHGYMGAQPLYHQAPSQQPNMNNPFL